VIIIEIREVSLERSLRKVPYSYTIWRKCCDDLGIVGLDNLSSF